MKYCVKCGSELRDEAVMCPHCGTTVAGRGEQLYKNTKDCEYCGAEVLKESVVCPKCGCPLKSNTVQPSSLYDVKSVKKDFHGWKTPNGLQTTAMAFMLISCALWVAIAMVILLVASSGAYSGLSAIGLVYLIPLTWIIPMYNKYSKLINDGEPVGVGFKVCTFLFVSKIAGICMLCDKDN